MKILTFVVARKLPVFTSSGFTRLLLSYVTFLAVAHFHSTQIITILFFSPIGSPTQVFKEPIFTLHPCSPVLCLRHFTIHHLQITGHLLTRNHFHIHSMHSNPSHLQLSSRENSPSEIPRNQSKKKTSPIPSPKPSSSFPQNHKEDHIFPPIPSPIPGSPLPRTPRHQVYHIQDAKKSFEVERIS